MHNLNSHMKIKSEKRKEEELGRLMRRMASMFHPSVASTSLIVWFVSVVSHEEFPFVKLLGGENL